MATVRPFAGVRPAREVAEEMASLPYDVMNRAEAAKMAEGKPHSFLHICRSEIDLPEVADPYDERVYARARENLDRFLEEGALLQDPSPCYYIYRQTMDGNTQTGIVATVSVDEYEDGTIKKHELTRAEKEADRIRHFDVCDANTEPIFLTYRTSEGIEQVVSRITDTAAPEYDFVTTDGVGHILWKVDNNIDIDAIRTAFTRVQSLYIADGHHRSASAYRVAKKRREEHPEYTGEEEFNFFMAVIFPSDELRVFDYNRVVRDLNGRTAEAFLDEIEAAGWHVRLAGEAPVSPERPHVFSMYLEGTWYRLEADASIVPQDIIGALDVSVLQDHLLGPILGIDDPRTDHRIDFVGGIRGLTELKRRADEDMKVAIAVYPVRVEELMAVADEGRIMPPKSTWFEPKLSSGLFLHRL